MEGGQTTQDFIRTYLSQIPRMPNDDDYNANKGKNRVMIVIVL